MSRGTGSRIVTCEGQFVAHTELAVCFEDARDQKVWLPKSKIELQTGRDYDDFDKDETITVYVPEWLAMEKGLI